MPTQFGPQLIGETEKTLNALLRRALAGRLSEPQWVALRISLLPAGPVGSSADLSAEVGARAHFEDAEALVTGLSRAGLLADGQPTDAGRALVAEVQAEVATLTAAVWDGLPSDDVEAAGRVLNTVVARGREALSR